MSKNNLSTHPKDMQNSGANNENFIYVPSNSRDKRNIKSAFSHQHMIETIERFEYEGLPEEIDQDLIERILYFRFKGAFFKYNDVAYFLPFTLNGTIDSYGRYEHISPTVFTGTVAQGKSENLFLPESATNKKFKVIYNKKQAENLGEDELAAVILTDSTLEVSQDWTPMNEIITPFIEQQTEIIVLLNIDLVSSAKVFYIVAKDSNQKQSIENEFEKIDQNILQGKRVVVLSSDTELKELQGSSAKDSARYMQSFQSIVNIRRSIIGTDNGGAFLKQEHMTDEETKTNSNQGGAVINNALRMRKKALELCNHVFGWSASVKISESSEVENIADEGSQTIQIKEGEE